MSKHTPGPWEEMGGLITAERRDARGFFCKPISICRPMRNLKSSSANARLIAAAPDLLESLQQYGIGFTDEAAARAEFGNYEVDRELKRRAAIAKATGEQP